MRTTLVLLNEITNLGFDQQKALRVIDANLDKKLGIQNRKPLSDEELDDDIYENILDVFQTELDERSDRK